MKTYAIYEEWVLQRSIECMVCGHRTTNVEAIANRTCPQCGMQHDTERAKVLAFIDTLKYMEHSPWAHQVMTEWLATHPPEPVPKLGPTMPWDSTTTVT